MLNPITSLPGVLGAALFEQNQGCIAHSLSPPYEPVLLAEAAERLSETQDAMASVGLSEPEFLAAKFDMGSAVVVTDGELRVVVLCDEQTNLNMLRVALKVVTLKARKLARPDVGASRSQNDRSHNESVFGRGRLDSDRPSEVYEVPFQDAPPGEVHQSTGLPNVARSLPAAQMSWGERSTAPAGTVGIKVMQHVLRALSRHLGDDARPVMEGELLAMRATPRSLSVAQFADLIRAAAKRIPDDEGRRYFIGEALGDRGR